MEKRSPNLKQFIISVFLTLVFIYYAAPIYSTASNNNLQNIYQNWQDVTLNFQMIENGNIIISLNEKNDVRNSIVANHITSAVNSKGMIIMPGNAFNDTVKFKTQLDISVFLSIVILSFLLSHKLVRYISKFKISEKGSSSDVIFLSVIIALLFIPVSHISQKERSELENRILSPAPQLINSGFNLQYPKQFEQWFNDRFQGRNALINLHRMLYKLQSVKRTDKVLIGKNGWMFFTSDNAFNNFANRTRFSQEALAKGLKYLQDFDTWCKKNNKKFYYVIVPDKHKIYGENYRLVKRIAPDEEGIGYQLINYIHGHSTVSAIYLRDELLKHKNEDLLYYKNDSHWNYLGAYYGYKKIMETMNLKSLELTFENTDTNEKADLTEMYKQKEEPIIYKKPRLKEWIQCTGDEWTQMSRQDTNPRICRNSNDSPNKLNIFVLRDSYSKHLIPYLSATFKESYFAWRPNVTKEDLDFIKEHADIVLIENVERYTPGILIQEFPKE